MSDVKGNIEQPGRPETSERLGKIEKVIVGAGGYQDAQFGFWVFLKGPDFDFVDGVGVFLRDDALSEEAQEAEFANLGSKLAEICIKARVKNMTDLIGKPVAVTVEDGTGKVRGWRILHEVL